MHYQVLKRIMFIPILSLISYIHTEIHTYTDVYIDVYRNNDIFKFIQK